MTEAPLSTMTEAYAQAPFAMKRDHNTMDADQSGRRSQPPIKRVLMPAPLRKDVPVIPRKSFYDLPPEIRIEIYKLVLTNVRVHILPTRTATEQFVPHALVRTSRLVRSEVLPIMHAQCPIIATVTDFNFDGMREWMQRMPPDQEANLCKNTMLSIQLATTVSDQKNASSNSLRNSNSLRRWLHMRADKHRPQPAWQYNGTKPDSKTTSELTRRAKRSANPEEQREMWDMLKAIGIMTDTDGTTNRSGHR